MAALRSDESPPFGAVLADDAERARLSALHGYAILDTGPEGDFDDLTRLAAFICTAPMAMVSLVDSDRQWFKSRFGLERHETPRSESFCAHALDRVTPLVVPDARADARFVDNPLVTGPPRIRAYAGAPLLTPDGYVLGTLCVLDTAARPFTPGQLDRLATLARQVVAQVLLRRQAGRLADEVATRTASEAELVRSKDLLDGLLTYANAAFYAKDLEGRYLVANAAALRLHDLSGQAVIGRSTHDLLPTEDAERIGRSDRAVVELGTQQRFLEYAQSPDGSVHDYLSTKFPLRDVDGRIYAVGGVSADVTELTAQRRRHAEAEQRWRALFECSPVGICVLDESGVLVNANPALGSMLGRPASHLVGHRSIDFGHPDDHRIDIADLVDRAPNRVANIERRFVLPDGQIRWAGLSLSQTQGPLGESWTLAHVQDITERRAVSQALAESQDDLAAVAEVIRDIQTGSDARQSVVHAGMQLACAAYVSLVEPDTDTSTLRVSASTESRLVGQEFSIDTPTATLEVYRTGRALFIADPELHPLVSPQLLSLTAARSIYLIPVTFSERVTAVLIVAWNHRVAGLHDRAAAVVRLLADHAGVALRQAALVSELETQAATDALTALPNRRSWDARLPDLLSSAQRTGAPLTVALADLDHFKAYNDAHGHPAGDLLLQRFARGAQSALRADDTVARWGGEEFIVALPNCPTTEAADVLDRLRAATPDGVTCSVGYATWDGVESPAELLTRIDQALYSAKIGGRNRSVAGGA